MNDLVPLPAGAIACAPGGRTTGALPEDSPELEAVEAFHDFAAAEAEKAWAYDEGCGAR